MNIRSTMFVKKKLIRNLLVKKRSAMSVCSVVHTMYQFLSRKSGFTIKPKAPLMMMMAYNVIEKKTHRKTSFSTLCLRLMESGCFFLFIQILLRVSCYTLVFLKRFKKEICVYVQYTCNMMRFCTCKGQQCFV